MRDVATGLCIFGESLARCGNFHGSIKLDPAFFWLEGLVLLGVTSMSSEESNIILICRWDDIIGMSGKLWVICVPLSKRVKYISLANRSKYGTDDGRRHMFTHYHANNYSEGQVCMLC